MTDDDRSVLAMTYTYDCPACGRRHEVGKISNDPMCTCEHPKSDHAATGCQGWIVGPDRDEYRCGCDGFEFDACAAADGEVVPDDAESDSTPATAAGLTTEDVENMLDRAGRNLAGKAAMVVSSDLSRRDALLDLSSRIDDVINDLQEWSDA